MLQMLQRLEKMNLMILLLTRIWLTRLFCVHLATFSRLWCILARYGYKGVSSFTYCQAQPKPQLQLSWGLSLHYSQCDPASRQPPPTHPRRNSRFFVSHSYSCSLTCLWLVQNLFTTSSWFPQNILRTCSGLVHNFLQIFHNLFKYCSFEHYFFMTCSLFFHDLFTTSSWLVNYLFKAFPHFFTTYSWLVLEVLPTCSQLFQNVFITCSGLVHIFFLTCAWIAILVH